MQTSFERGSLDNWHGSSYSLIFGNEVGGVRPWEGYLDGVAIYSRFIGADEAAKKFTLAGPSLARPAGDGSEDCQGGDDPQGQFTPAGGDRSLSQGARYQSLHRSRNQ